MRTQESRSRTDDDRAHRALPDDAPGRPAPGGFLSTIVVGDDESPDSAHALHWAAQVADLSGSRLVVVAPGIPDQAELPPEVVDTAVARMRAEERGRARAAGAGGAEIRSKATVGEGAEAIARAATGADADLVVVGAHPDAGTGRIGLGTTAHHLAHSFHRPIAAVHDRDEVGPGTQVIVGVDGSEGSEEALRWAIRFADLIGGSAVPLLAYDDMVETFPGPPQGRTYPHEEKARGVVSRCALETGRQLELRVEPGRAVEVLASAADGAHPAVVVVGTRSHGPLQAHVLGRVPMVLLHHCHEPVVLVPHHH